MTEVPDKSQKQKRRQKKKKLKELQSFLIVEKVDSAPVQQIPATKGSDHQQKTNQSELNFCTICEADLGEKKRICGFCSWPACNQHMRKKRRNKEVNKYVRICDNCEDKYLYTKYMKMELKNQESMAIQETILEAARDEIENKVNQKRARMDVHRKKQKQILQKRSQYETKWKSELNQIAANTEKLEIKQKQLEKLEEELKQFEANLPPALEDDYKTLELQNERVKKQIFKYEKLCIDAASVKNKRQKQIYDQYQKWQNDQRIKIQQKQKEECRIF